MPSLEMSLGLRISSKVNWVQNNKIIDKSLRSMSSPAHITSIKFTFTLWRKLFTRFGVEFFRQFRGLSPSDQVDALFSGFYGLELDENVRLESLKILLQSLKLLSWHLPLDNLMLS